jgi:hypothetical protein
MNHNTPFRLRRAIVLGLVVATAIVTSTAGAAINPRFVNPTAGGTEASTGQPALPPGATLEPTAASTVEPALPPGATPSPSPVGEPVHGYLGLPCQPNCDPGISDVSSPGTATSEVPAAMPQAVIPAPALSNPVVEIRGGFDWADAGIGAAIAFAGMLLLGSALLVLGRRGQRDPLAGH